MASVDDTALVERAPTLPRRVAVFGAYGIAAGLTFLSVGGLVGIGGAGIAVLPGVTTSAGALFFGLTVGAVVAAVYVLSGVTVKTIFEATCRAERALIEAPRVPGRGRAAAGDLSLTATEDGGELSPPEP